MEIEKITDKAGKDRPKCQERVKPTHWGKVYRQRAGVHPDQCGQPSFFRVDGAPMCQNHTAMRALKHMLGE